MLSLQCLCLFLVSVVDEEGSVRKPTFLSTIFKLIFSGIEQNDFWRSFREWEVNEEQKKGDQLLRSTRVKYQLELSTYYRVVPEMTNEILTNFIGLTVEWKYSSVITALVLMKVLPEYSVHLCCPHTLTRMLASWFRRKPQGSSLLVNQSLSCKDREKRNPVHCRGNIKVDIMPIGKKMSHRKNMMNLVYTLWTEDWKLKLGNCRLKCIFQAARTSPGVKTY